MSETPPSTATGGAQSKVPLVKRRTPYVWLFLGVFLGGSAIDWLGLHSWGPAQSQSGDWLTVRASATLFWLALAMLLVCGRDVMALWLSGESNGKRGATRGSGRVAQVSDAARGFARDHQAIIGAVGLAAGAVVGHFFWQP